MSRFRIVTADQLAGAGIDVFRHEPPLTNHPLIDPWRDHSHPAHDRVIINPHAALLLVGRTPRHTTSA